MLSIQKQTYNIHTFCKPRLSYPKWTTQQIQAALKILAVFVMSDTITTAVLSLTLVLSVFIFKCFHRICFLDSSPQTKVNVSHRFQLDCRWPSCHSLSETAFVGFKMNDRKPYVKISKSFLVIVSGASVFFLVLILLERSFALKRPLRHRVTSTKVYTHGIVIVWLAGIALGALKLLPIYGIFDLKYYVVAYSVIIALSLLLICFSYLSIRKRFCKRNPVLDTGYSRKSVEQNTKLSKTLFIVIGASVALWAPSMSLHNLGLLCEGLFPGFVNYIFGMFHLTNSLINLIIYSLRMPLFRKILQQLKNKLRVPHWWSKNYAVTKIRVKCWRSTRLKRGGDGVESLISFLNTNKIIMGHKRQSFKFTLKFANGISHFLQQSYSRIRYAHPENYSQHPRIRIKWIKSLTLAEIGHFKPQKCKI